MYTLHIYIYKYDLADNREHLDSWPLKYKETNDQPSNLGYVLFDLNGENEWEEW